MCSCPSNRECEPRFRPCRRGSNTLNLGSCLYRARKHHAKHRERVLSHLAEQPECSRAMINRACATSNCRAPCDRYCRRRGFVDSGGFEHFAQNCHTPPLPRQVIRFDYGHDAAPCPREVESCVKSVAHNQAQDDPHGKWEPSPSGVMHDGRCGKVIPHATNLKLASASDQHILDPLAFPSIGQRNEESVRRSEYINGRPVNPA